MSDSLTTLISKIQATLLDDGTRYTTATITAAVRQALSEFNAKAPVHAGTLLDVVADQKEYELTDIDIHALALLSVHEQDTGGEDDTPLLYDQYQEDARLWFRLRTALTSGTLIVRYTIPYTINGLDSEVESTLSAYHDTVLINGGCYWSLLIRAAGRVEPINLNQDVSDNLDALKATFRTAFDAGLAEAAKQSAPVGEPDASAWNDKYHTWDQ